MQDEQQRRALLGLAIGREQRLLQLAPLLDAIAEIWQQRRKPLAAWKLPAESYQHLGLELQRIRERHHDVTQPDVFTKGLNVRGIRILRPIPSLALRREEHEAWNAGLTGRFVLEPCDALRGRGWNEAIAPPEDAHIGIARAHVGQAPVEGRIFGGPVVFHPDGLMLETTRRLEGRLPDVDEVLVGGRDVDSCHRPYEEGSL